MPRFYFVIVTEAGLIDDPEGSVMSDLEEAMAEARDVVDDLSDEIDDPNAVMEIRDDTGAVLGRVPVRSIN
jgi:hypothetical protein